MLGHKIERMTSYNYLMSPRSILFKRAILSPITFVSFETHTQEAMDAGFFYQQDEEARACTSLAEQFYLFASSS
jgi:hypothetical protein